MPSLVKTGPVVLGKKSIIGKDYRWTDRQTDRQWTTGDKKSSGELKKIQNLKGKKNCNILQLYT